MKLNDLQSKYESRIERVSRWLDETYGFKVYDNVSLAELYKVKADLDAQRESLKRSLPFNTYHENPQYAKNLLLSEAVVLMIGHIDDKEKGQELKNIYKTIKKAKKKLLKVAVKYDGPVEAPIKKNQKIATLRVVYDQELVGEYDLLSSKEIKKVNLLSRILKSINYLIWGDV